MKYSVHKPVIILVSLMPGHGGTGVETHMRHLVRSLEAQQTPACVVTPYAGRFCLQRVANFVANRFMRTHPEASWLWLRRVYVKLLTERLRRLVCRLEPHGPIVFSAQDALSAQVAMQVRDAFAPEASVALTVHFNVSEAQEFVDKGLARRDGALYQALVETEDRAMTQVDRLIFVSEFSERVCRARNPGLADSQVLANFVPEPDTPEVESTLADAVAIGSLEGRKNQQFLLRVIAECRSRGRHYSLTLAGQGEDRRQLTRLAEELGIRQQVHFLGHVPDAQQLIPRHRVLLHAATMESFGIVIVESMAHGVPVIASRVGGTESLFTHGVEGYFWDLACVRSAADLLIDLLETEGRADALGRRAKSTFETRFDPGRLAAQWHSALLSA